MDKLLIIVLTLTMIFIISCSKELDHLDKARAFLEINRYEDAIKHAELAIQNNPRDIKAHLLKGEAYLMLDKLDNANSTFSNAILINNKAKNNIADLYFNIGKKKIGSNDKMAFILFKESIKHKNTMENIVIDYCIDIILKRIDSTANISSDIFNIATSVFDITSSHSNDIFKNKLADEFVKRANNRWEDKLVESSIVLAVEAWQLNPLVQQEVITLITNIGYDIIDKTNDLQRGRKILAQAKNIDSELLNSDKYFIYYYILNTEDNHELDIDRANEFIQVFPKSQYLEIVYYKFVEYYFFNLELDNAKFYVDRLNVNFPDTKYKRRINSIESEINKISNE